MGSSCPKQTEYDIASKNLIERVNTMLQKGKSNCKLTNLSIQHLESQSGKHKYVIDVRVQKDPNCIISYALKGKYYYNDQKSSVKEIQFVTHTDEIHRQLKGWIKSLKKYEIK